MCDVVTMTIGLEDRVGSTQIRGDRVADTSGVDRAAPTCPSVRRLMGVPAADHVGIGAAEERREVSIGEVRGDARAVVGPW